MSFNEAKKNVIYADQCGVEETEQAITRPHSLVDAAAMSMWKAAAMASMSEQGLGTLSAVNVLGIGAFVNH